MTDSADEVYVRAGLSLGEREALIARLCAEARSLSSAWTKAVAVSVCPTDALQDSAGFRFAEAAFALSEARPSELCGDPEMPWPRSAISYGPGYCD